MKAEYDEATGCDIILEDDKYEREGIVEQIVDSIYSGCFNVKEMEVQLADEELFFTIAVDPTEYMDLVIPAVLEKMTEENQEFVLGFENDLRDVGYVDESLTKECNAFRGDYGDLYE